MIMLRMSMPVFCALAFTCYIVCETTLAIPIRSHNNIDIYISAILRFPDSAHGGELSVVNLSDDKRDDVIVSTSEGEIADSVTQKISDALLDSEIPKLMPSTLFPVNYDKEILRVLWKLEGAISMCGRQGEVVLGGTETGLGILPPMGALSASVESRTRQYELRWHAKSEYDEVYVRQLGTQLGDEVERLEEKNVTSHVVPFRELPREVSRPLYVVGFRNGLPTNASYIIASLGQQVDSFFHPFTGGLTTGWTGWVGNGGSNVLFLEKRFEEDWPAAPVHAWKQTSNRSAQIIHTGNIAGEGGMYRFFVAQTPGQSYRPALRSHIMKEAEDFQGEWAFDIMTGVVDPERAYEMDNATRVMTADSWAELEANGEQISIWRFDHTMPRSDKWIMNQTGAQDSDILQKDIILGDSKTAVFFCVRLTGHKPNGIAMDGVRLVDVTDGFPNAEMREYVL